MTLRLLATSPLVGPYLEELGRDFPELCIAPFRSPEWRRALPQAEAVLVSLTDPVSAADLDQAPRLRVLGTCSVGVNHLPLDYCRQRGIPVVNTPGVLTDATADLALAMLLGLTRGLAAGEAVARSGAWNGWALDQIFGIGLAGKTCGILGSGPIGRAFARRVAVLGMRPLFWARDGRSPVDFGTGSAERLPLAELLPRSEVLSLHCPLTAETRGLLSAGRLGLLPPGAIVLNTARGGILDEPALIRMLHQGALGGVGLDVYEAEPEINRDWFSAPRCMLLPHLGSSTRETREAMAKLLCDGIRATLGGKLG